MKQPPVDVSVRHWELIVSILHRNVPEREVWAFGSRANRTAKKSSVLGLAIIGDSPLPLSASAALADDFSESDLPFKVDVVDWATTSESFRKIIAQSKVVVQQAPSP